MYILSKAKLVEKGTLIEFRLQGESRLAVVERPEGKKDWIVIDAKGQSHKLKPQRVEYQVTGGSYQPADIPDFINQVEPYLDPSSLAVAWEILVEDKQSVTPAAMAELLFSQQSPPLCYAAYKLLSEDKIYFKKKGDVYEPRSPSQVEEIKHQLEIQAQKKKEKAEFLLHLQAALQGDKVEWTAYERSGIESLEKFVLQPELNHRHALDILASIGREPNPQAAFELLVEIGWWTKHENLFLRRSSYPVNFPPKVLNVVDSYLQTPPADPDEDNRLDLTRLKVYTIDDESTEEIDDGLSIEYLEEGKKIKIWIHIADPTRLISPGDSLDLEARRRSTTMYLPTGMIPMFPAELATGPMSLIQGKICPALSFSVILAENGSIQSYSIHPSLIKPTYRLTYDDVDEMLQMRISAEPEITDLAKAAKIRRQWRTQQGSISIQMPEASIKVKKLPETEEEEITIELLQPSPSRQLVAEMMILTGEVAGKYCQTHQLAVPFRSQQQPELPPDEELSVLPPGPVRFSALRRCMPRSEIGISPARHASLALDTYTQVTSPIRRYTDLLAHFQLKAHLRGDALPFQPDELLEIVYSVGSSAQEVTSVERHTNRYWGLEFLRRHADVAWQVLVLRWLREDEGLALILLEELGLELVHRFDRPVALGERLTFQVARVDPQRDEIRFRELLSEVQLN